MSQLQLANSQQTQLQNKLDSLNHQVRSMQERELIKGRELDSLREANFRLEEEKILLQSRIQEHHLEKKVSDGDNLVLKQELK